MQIMFKQSMFLMTVPVIVGLYTGIAHANEIEVKAGNTQVSVQNGKVEIERASQIKTLSLLERLNNLRLFGDRSSSADHAKCDRASSGYSSTRSNSSGTAVSRTSSSSTTMTCN
jgi:hypothetical protein